MDDARMSQANARLFRVSLGYAQPTEYSVTKFMRAVVQCPATTSQAEGVLDS